MSNNPDMPGDSKPPVLSDKDKEDLQSVRKFIRDLEIAGKIPEVKTDLPIYPADLSGKSVRVLRMEQFGNFWVSTSFRDFPLTDSGKQAVFRDKKDFIKQYTIDTTQVSYFDAADSGKLIIFYDTKQNAPLKTYFNKDIASQSSQLVSIFGASNFFEQFIAGIRGMIASNWRRTIVTLIIGVVIGGALVHFI